MKKIKLKLDGREMLSKEQMKKISGGYSYLCCAIGVYPFYCVSVAADNCCSAQGICDFVAYSNAETNNFPNGGDVVCPNWPNC